MGDTKTLYAARSGFKPVFCQVLVESNNIFELTRPKGPVQAPLQLKTLQGPLPVKYGTKAS